MTGREELEQWLQKQPREAAIALACRAAMRAMPALGKLLQEDEEAFHVVLPTVRAIAVAGVAVMTPPDDSAFLAAAQAAAEDADVLADEIGASASNSALAALIGAARKETESDPTIAKLLESITDDPDMAGLAASADKEEDMDMTGALEAVWDAIQSAAFAASAAVRNTVANTANAIESAADSIESIAFHGVDDTARAIKGGADTRSIFWGAVMKDRDYLGNGKSALDLLNTPLWPNGMPDMLSDLWKSMKSRLLARKNEHWEVWTQWYDARLDPSREIPCYSPLVQELERNRALLPEELWQKGASAVNLEIRRLLEKHGCK